jgi:hypothetical protein
MRAAFDQFGNLKHTFFSKKFKIHFFLSVAALHAVSA